MSMYRHFVVWRKNGKILAKSLESPLLPSICLVQQLFIFPRGLENGKKSVFPLFLPNGQTFLKVSRSCEKDRLLAEKHI